MGSECSIQQPKSAQELPRPPTLASEEKQTQAHLRTSAFSVQEATNRSWRETYRTLREIGQGATSCVLHAEAATEGDPGLEPLRCRMSHCGFADQFCLDAARPTIPICTPPLLHCLRSAGRPVAIKQYRKPNTRSFQLELAALMRVGVHPHIVRLLASFSSDSEDALVLEYCDSLTLYDLVVRRHRSKEQFGDLLVSRLIYQLLLAVDHVASCGLAHQDVKPENLMLCDLSVPEERVRLKLGDFGWAVLGADQSPPAPAGAGSLWYAPPELNPPVEGASIFPGAVIGKSDIWSSGVVIYLLLVGHNPFHLASKLKDMQKEVLRLVARGSFDKTCPAWTALSKDVKELLRAALTARPEHRASSRDVLAAPFVGRCRERCEAAVPQEITEQSSSLPSLHGDLRDLAYLALARASAEAELNEDVVLSASAHIQWGPDSKEGSRAYLGQLARGMAGVPPAFWCKNTSFCADQIRLAFRYLDVDADGMLSAMDLAYHIDSEISKSLPIAGQWLQHWSQQNPAGLSELDFRAMLLESSWSHLEPYVAESP